MGNAVVADAISFAVPFSVTAPPFPLDAPIKIGVRRASDGLLLVA